MNQPSFPLTLCWRDASGGIFSAPSEKCLSPGFLDLIDQTLLPEKVVRLALSTPAEIYDAIKRLAVRGAPAIGCAAALGLAACAQRFQAESRDGYMERLEEVSRFLESSRPTAVNLPWALARCRAALEGVPFELLNERLLREALLIVEEDCAMCRKIGENGVALLRDGMNILTHCNAGALATAGCGTALAPIYTARERGYRIHVYSDETRPLLQGARLTAWELAESGIEVTTICDSMSAMLMRSGKIDCVIVGADRVAANGDFANKIGTYGVAVNAYYHHIPFYVAIPYSTLDRSIPDGNSIVIEERSPEEIFHCEGADVFNPAFDVTPHALVSSYITERGVFQEI